jgi:hypothetical protein
MSWKAKFMSFFILQPQAPLLKRVVSTGWGRFVLLKILKYDIVRDVAAHGGEEAPSPKMPPPVALAQVRDVAPEGHSANRSLANIERRGG